MNCKNYVKNPENVPGVSYQKDPPDLFNPKHAQEHSLHFIGHKASAPFNLLSCKILEGTGEKQNCVFLGYFQKHTVYNE